MKIYISADIEGVCGATDWDEALPGGERYLQFQQQMTREVKAACEGAVEAGAKEIYVRDAHDTARNIIASELPENTKLIRGWSRHPYMMMQELDSTFDAALMIGYHSLAGGMGNPLAHTMNSRIIEVTINNRPASEFLINWYTAMLEHVPVVFVSGDQEVCSHAMETIADLSTVAVKTGCGASTVNIHPATAVKMIKSSVSRVLKGKLSDHLQELPERFEVTIAYVSAHDAYKASFYPGARLLSSRIIGFHSEKYLDVLRLFLFNL